MTASLSKQMKSANFQSYRQRPRARSSVVFTVGKHYDPEMLTYYRPSEYRGKRMVYKSTDSDEPKRHRRKMMVFLGVVTFFVLVAAAIALFMR
jgi:hypothetical protein